jgi:hypothetical protein
MRRAAGRALMTMTPQSPQLSGSYVKSTTQVAILTFQGATIWTYVLFHVLVPLAS